MTTTYSNTSEPQKEAQSATAVIMSFQHKFLNSSQIATPLSEAIIVKVWPGILEKKEKEWPSNFPPESSAFIVQLKSIF